MEFSLSKLEVFFEGLDLYFSIKDSLSDTDTFEKSILLLILESSAYFSLLKQALESFEYWFNCKSSGLLESEFSA